VGDLLVEVVALKFLAEVEEVMKASRTAHGVEEEAPRWQPHLSNVHSFCGKNDLLNDAR